MNKGFAYAIFERSGLRKLLAERLKSRQIDDLCDRFNVTAVWRRPGLNPKVGDLMQAGRSPEKSVGSTRPGFAVGDRQLAGNSGSSARTWCFRRARGHGSRAFRPAARPAA